MEVKEKNAASTGLPSFDEIRETALKHKVQTSPNIDLGMTDAELNEVSLRPLFFTTKAYFIFTIALSSLVAMGGAAWLYQIFIGMGAAGLKHPVFWGLYIATFVFWIGLSHSGTIVSCLLRLSRANWRRPILRGAEAMTVFSLCVAGLFPLIHIGRIWRVYYMFPIPNQRELWPNYRSPLMWDETAITCYLTASVLFFLVGLIPDLAIARDRAPQGWRKQYLTVMALGWRGTQREWHVYEYCSHFLAIFVLCIAPSVHTIVSWDFAMTITPGWHTTIFGPYFVVGAINSGVAGVIALMIIFRWVFKLENVIKVMHLNDLAKLQLTITIIWSYFYFCEFITAWYGQNPTEWRVWEWQGERFPYHLLIMLGGSAVSIALLAFSKVRTTPIYLFSVVALINVGMFIERYLIVVPILSHRDNPYMWTDYFPSPVELSIAVGSFAYFVLLYAIFAKTLPIVTIADIKEGNVVSGDMRIGNKLVRVQARLEE